MNTFRYNPSVQRWVMLGGAIQGPIHLTSAHFLDAGRASHFKAASYPKQPFMIEPPATFGSKYDNGGLVYAEQAPVGEYELLLYTDEESVSEWDVRQWGEWLELLQHRLIHLHHNPYLHHVMISLRTSTEDSVEDYKRVGDVVATSHAIAGEPALLTADVVEKIRRREKIFTLAEGEHGSLQVPSAPLYQDEIWYLPKQVRAGIEGVHGAGRKAAAHALGVIFRTLHQLDEEHPYILRVHTTLAGGSDTNTTWWLQIYRDSHSSSLVPISPLPEAFLQKLHFALKH